LPPFTVSVTEVLCTIAPFPNLPVKISVNVPCVQFLFGLNVTVDETVPPSATTDGEIEQVEF